MSARRGLLLAAAVVVLDQLTKAWIVATFPYGSERTVIPGLFDLVHTRNRGIAFGLLGSSGQAVQIALLVVVIGVVAFLARQLWRNGHDGFAAFGLSLVLGGAVGNLVDRLARGEVVDFLDAYVTVGGMERHWPAFNVADASISIGAGCVILAELLAAARAKRAPRPD
ncbi:MAG: signal peptidase II [Acidobacteriota bacterium]